MVLLIKEKINKTPPFILTSSHSGTKFPKNFCENKLINVDKKTLLMVSDLFVDELIENIKPFNLIKLISEYSRAYIDLNRNIQEIDKKRIKSFKLNHNFNVSGYTRNGYGLIHTKTYDQRDIYKNLLSFHDVEKRIIKIYKPWHQTLQKKIEELKNYNDQVFIIDFHSMPSEIFNHNQFKRADIVLGDQYGTSSSPEFTNILKTLFEEHGFSVVKNVPYKGGYISKNYGIPSKGVHAIQIEIRRDLYMDEKKLSKKNEFNNFKNRLEIVIENYIKNFIGEVELEFAAQ